MSQRKIITAIIGNVPSAVAGEIAVKIDRAGSHPRVICYAEPGHKLLAETIAQRMNAHSMQVDAEVFTDQSRANAWIQTVCGDGAEQIEVAIVVSSQNALPSFFFHFITPTTKAGQILAKLPHMARGDVVMVDLPKRKKDRSGWIFLNGHRQGIMDGKVVNVDKNGNSAAITHGEHGHGLHSVEQHPIGVTA